MKPYYCVSLLCLLSLSVFLNVYQSNIGKVNADKFDNPTFIWNDDLEALPKDHSLLLLEYTSNDTIYIGSVDDYDSPEYQFTVTEDSISVTDYGRKVGTVKIQGQLKELIDQDNE